MSVTAQDITGDISLLDTLGASRLRSLRPVQSVRECEHSADMQ